MITLTTYGTWLQGDKRGYVKKGKTLPGNKSLMDSNARMQSQNAIWLSADQRQIVREAIVREAASRGQHIYALAVRSNHVHLIIEYSHVPIGAIVAYYKKAGRLALKAADHSGKLWTRGYDKRYCFDSSTLKQRIKYVQDHNT
jgi:REP element-mobilizing transposase RayT